MALVLSPFPLNVGKIENNGIANSHMWQMGNWVRETLRIRLKARLQLRSCPLSVILGGVALQEAQRKLLIWFRSTIWAGCYLDDLVPAKPAVWSSSASSITVCSSWHKVWSPNMQDWERRWGQLHKSLVEINILYARGASGVSAQNWASCSGSCIVLEAFLGEKGIRHYSLEEHWSNDKAVLGTPPDRSSLHCSRSVSVHGWAAWDSGWIY